VWDGRKTIFDRLTTASDSAEVFGVVEFVLPMPQGMTGDDSARMIFDGRIGRSRRTTGKSCVSVSHRAMRRCGRT
jgi:hypothetical protein